MRAPGWESRLDLLIQEFRAAPFKWGERDCLQLSFGVIRALVGTDLYPEERGRYSTLAESRDRLKARGFNEPVDVIAFHFAEAPVDRARVGDIGLAPAKHGPALVVFRDEGLVGCTPRGMVLLPRRMALRAFAVG